MGSADDIGWENVIALVLYMAILDNSSFVVPLSIVSKSR